MLANVVHPKGNAMNAEFFGNEPVRDVGAFRH